MEIVMEHPIYFLFPILMIIVGIYFLLLHRRRCPLCGRSVRPFWRECLCTSEPPTVFSETFEEERENELPADTKPFSHDQKPEEKGEIESTTQVTSFFHDGAQPLFGERMGTEVMLPSISPSWLLIEEWGMPEKRYEITKKVISIGTNDDNDIILTDKAVSRHHAKIRVEKERYFVYDLASTNGTRVNDRKITKKWIKEGDRIELGHTKMTFKTEALAGESPEHKPSDLLKM